MSEKIDTTGWDEIGSSVDAFYVPVIGQKLIGRVLEDFDLETQFGKQTLVKIKLAEPLAGVIKDGEQVNVPVGGVMAVRISAGLLQLLDCVTNQCAVEIVPLEKIKVKRGSMWKYRIRTKGERVRRQTQAEARPVAREAEDDLPF